MSDSHPDDDCTETHVILGPGVMVAHYRIVEKIGAGGMGEVFLAEDTKLNRRVALKFLPTHLVGDSDIRARFVREAQASAKLNHPNIVTIHEVGEFNARPFFAMEYVTGNPLSHYCHDSRLSISETIAMAIQICEGLGKAHQSGVVHRDIKPANIVVDADQRPRILDFGLAAVQGTDTLTKTGSTLGTIGYMSPEQAQGKAIDQRSDIFSFGVVLYELITGQTPFKRDNEAATLQAIVSDDAEPVARFRANVPRELQRIVSKLLERDPSLRYQAAPDAIADLKKLAITGSSPVVKAIEVRRSRGPLYVAVIGVIAVVAIVAVYLTKGTDSGPTHKQMTITPITSDGKVASVAISPDGNYVAYVKEDLGVYGLWVEHVTTSSKVPVVEASTKQIAEPVYAPDGSFVYYLTEGPTGLPELHRTPALGGPSQTILTNVWSKISFAPDGARIAFLRESLEGRESTVVIADVDGSREQALTTIDGAEYFFSAPAWSPDGRTIAITKGRTKPRVESVLVVLDAVSGEEILDVSGDWINSLDMAWLPDGKGLTLAAESRGAIRGGQLWQVTYPGGVLSRITNDLSDYGSVSMTSDGGKLAALQRDLRAGVWLVALDDPADSRQICSGKYDGYFGLSWAGKDSLMYSSRSGKVSTVNRHWIDRGDSALVLTGDPIVGEQSVSRDGRSMVYVDWTNEYSVISRSDVGGRNRTQITPDGEYHSPDLSPDGSWAVFFLSAENEPAMFRVSIEGGEMLPLTRHRFAAWPVVISPDGESVALWWGESGDDPQPKIAILPAEGGNPLQLLEIPDPSSDSFDWSSDGSSILYVASTDGVDNIWKLSLDGGPGEQITRFKDASTHIRRFDLSPDGKTLALCRYESSGDIVSIADFH